MNKKENVMKTMDFKLYIEQKRKEAHKDIIKDICIVINNCADCYNEECKKVKCNPYNCIELYKVSGKSFYIEPYGSKTNRELIDIATKHGYKTEFVIDGEEIYIKFYK